MKRIIIIIVLLAIIVAGVFFYLKGNDLLGMSITKNERIEKTPIAINNIKQIKQWEFLSVTTEEVVDTVRKNRILKDDELCCIYYGTLRLGVNLEQAADDWATVNNDSSITVKLPAIGLLDDQFIDEASTRVFYEEGSWEQHTMEQLYQKAANQMRRRALTKVNLAKAEENGRQTFTKLFETLGFKHVEVIFAK